MAVVPLHPVPIDSMGRRDIEQRLPKFGILHWFLVRSPPPIAPPAMDPLGDPVPDIIAVRPKLDVARLLQGTERFDCSRQLHAIVGRQLVAAANLALLSVGAQNGSPSTGAGVSFAGAICKDFDVG